MQNPLIYKRNIFKVLLILRLVELTLVTLIVYFVAIKIFDYAIFFMVLFIPTLLTSITQITIHKASVNFKTYYLFGLIGKTISVNAKNIVAMTLHQELLEIEEPATFDYNNPFDFLVFLSPTKTLATNMTEFKYKDDTGEIKTIKVKLKTKEYRIMWVVLDRDNQNSQS